MQRRTCSLLALSLLLLLGIGTLALMHPTPARAATVSWKCPAGNGDWDVGSNWDTGSKPTSADWAVINCPGVHVTLRTSETVNRPFLQGGATLDIVSGGILTATNDFWVDNISWLNIDQGGSLTTAGGSIWGIVVVNGTYVINGLIDVTSNGNITVNPPGRLIVSGTLDMTTGTLDLALGTLEILSGAYVNANLPITNTGTVKGKGTIQSDLINDGHVHPGLSPGILTIAGNYTQTVSGTLDIEINGATLGTQYSQLVVTGTATLSGTLSVQVGDFTPQASDSYQVGDFSVQSGDFTNKVVTGGTGTINVDQGIWVSSVTSDWKKSFLPLIRKP